MGITTSKLNWRTKEYGIEGKKLKRSLTAEHSAALNLLFKSKTDQYTSKVGV